MTHWRWTATIARIELVEKWGLTPVLRPRQECPRAQEQSEDQRYVLCSLILSANGGWLFWYRRWYRLRSGSSGCVMGSSFIDRGTRQSCFDSRLWHMYIKVVMEYFDMCWWVARLPLLTMTNQLTSLNLVSVGDISLTSNETRTVGFIVTAVIITTYKPPVAHLEYRIEDASSIVLISLSFVCFLRKSQNIAVGCLFMIFTNNLQIQLRTTFRYRRDYLERKSSVVFINNSFFMNGFSLIFIY